MESSRLLASRFELTRVAHSGGMGQLFAGLDRQTGQPVAIKMALSVPGAAERLLAEARTLALLDHPSIVRYVAHGETSSTLPYLVMEWLEGDSVAAALERGPLPIQDVIEIGTRGAGALAHLHHRDLIHRDVSPSNLVLRDGRADHAKLVDFGLAHATRDGQSTVKFVGSPSYAAPEQARGVAELDARADLFSLGAVLFEAITGVPAFEGENVLAVLAKVALSEPDFGALSSRAPSGLCQLVRSLLRKSPDERPISASHVAEMLAELSFARPSLRSSRHEVSAVTTAERRLVTVVVARRLSEEAGSARPPTVPATEALVAAIDGKSTALAFLGRSSASDQARRAVRRAIEFAGAGPVAIASGWANLVDDNAVPSEWIDRSVQLLGDEAQEVRLDETTAGLLSSYFAVEAIGEGYRLSSQTTPFRSDAPRIAPLLGRQRELRTLRAVMTDALETPRALAVLISGPAGIGKSTLAKEFLRELSSTEDPPTLVELSADPLRANSPLALAQDFVSEALRLRKHASAEERRAEVARATKELGCDSPGLTADFLGELVDASDVVAASHEIAAARQDAILMGDQLKAALSRLVAALCGRQPTIIAIEDLHWADAATLQLLDGVLRAGVDLPLALIGITRPELHDRLPELWRNHDLQEIRVTALTRRASRKLVEHHLGDSTDEAELAWMVETAAGNAFYLEELVRAHRSGRGRDVPGSVVAMVRDRLEEMEPEARRVLRACSVFGARFWPAGVVALVGGDVVEDDVRAWFGTLEERELVESCGESRLPDQKQYQFRHALIRDAAYATLTDADRRSAHMSAAQWLEAAGESDASTLAEHYELGGQAEAAGPFWHRAAVIALDGNDFEAAALHAKRGLTSSTTSALSGALLSTAAEAERLRGHLSTAATLSERALGILARGSGRWFACVGERALVLQRLGEREQLRALTRDLLDSPPLPEALETSLLAKLRTALACSRVGEFDLARECRDAVVELPELASPLIFAWRHAVAAIVALNSGDRGEYLQQAEACRARYEQIGDRRAVLEQSINMASAYVELGRARQAAEMLTPVLREAKQLHLVHLIAGAQHNLGLALGRVGKFQEAFGLERDALLGFQRQDRRLEGGARVSTALIGLWAKEYELGQREAELGLALLRTAAPPLVPVALTALAALELAQGRAARAAALCAEAQEFVRAAGGVEYGESLLALTHANAHLVLGETSQARAIALTAARGLRERGERLADSELCESFLDDVPENRQLLELAAELSSDAG